MEIKIRKEVLDVLKEAYVALQKDDVRKLRELSDHTVHCSALEQDEGFIVLSVVVYGLSKAYERSNYREYKDWGRFHELVLQYIKEAYQNLNDGLDVKYLDSLKELLKAIDKLGSKLKLYVREVMERAHISKASRFYEHGVSIERTARLLGISQWELMEYVGGTGIADAEEGITIDVKDRLKFTRGLFLK